MKRSKISDEQIRDALQKAGGNRSRAATLLGISKQTIYSRLRSTRAGPPVGDDDTIAELWQRYAVDHGNLELRNLLVEAYLPLAKRAAAAVSFVVPKHVDQGAIVSGVQIALLHLVEKFDPSRGVMFRTYCQRRLHGAAIDELRDADPVSRQVRRRERQRIPAIEALEHRLGRRPTDEEIFDEVGDVTNSQILRRTVSLSTSCVERDDCVDPLALEDILGTKTPRETKQWFAEVTKGLDMDAKTAIYLHWGKGRTMREIGNMLNLSESRISQLLSSAIADLRKKGLENLLDRCPI